MDSVLTSATLVPVGMVCVVVITLFSGYRWMDSRFNRLENRVRAALSDRMTRTNHRIWVLEMQILNPAMKIPQATHEDDEDLKDLG